MKKTKKLAKDIQKLLPEDISNMMIVCIGTDRSTGDSFGPLVGTMLKQRGITNVVGTLHDPVHAVNLKETIETLNGKFIFAIDSCLSSSDRIGIVEIKKKPIRPGAGVNKDLGKVGDIGLYGIVNVGGFMEYMVLQNTRLSLVMDLAERTVNAIAQAFESRLAVLEVAAGHQSTE